MDNAPSPDAMAKHHTRAPRARVADILDTLVSLGKAREIEEGVYIGR